VRITHKVDYGVRVMATIAILERDDPGRPVTRAVLAERDDVPPGFLFDILRQLRNGELVRSVRGGDGGWLLARPAETITVADVIRALEGPLASVRGVRPHELAAWRQTLDPPQQPEPEQGVLHALPTADR